LPGPKGWPVVGNALQLRPDNAIEVFERWARQYRPFCVTRFPAGYLLLVTEPALAEGLLRARPDAVRRWGPIELVFEELGAAGLFSIEGDAWRTQRKLVMHALSHKHVRGFYPTLRLVAERLLASWQRAASEGRVLDPTSELMRFTSDVTVSLAFGTDMNSIERGEDALQRHLSLIFPAMGQRLNAIVPYWRYFKLPRDRRLARALASIRSVQAELLEAARARLAQKARATTEVEASDMLEAMVLARDEDGDAYSDEAIYGNMLTMLLAGEDTTAYALAWAMHFLCERPDVLARMRAEARERLGDNAVPETIESAGPLPFVDAVAEEVLRLKSPAPVLPLEAIKDLVLGDVFVPARTAIQTMTRVPALDERNFHDPMEFRPERWLGETPLPHEPKLNIPFGSGPRICAGRSLARIEMRLVLTLIAQQFELERVGESNEVSELTSFVMRPTGLRVKLHRTSGTAPGPADRSG
jgi:cytochrome P450